MRRRPESAAAEPAPTGGQPRAAPTGFVPPPIDAREERAVVMGVMLALLLAALDQTIVAPAMPTIGARLGHADYLPWIVTAYLLAATATAPLYGKVSDMYGRRLTMMGAVLVFLAGSVASALAPTMLALIAGRTLQGLGGGGLLALSQIVIGDLVPPRERARFAAWISGTWAVAGVSGPLLGGLLAEHLHWSMIFWINVPLGLLALVMMDRPLRKLPIKGIRQRFDLAGAALLVGACVALLLALNWGGSTYAWTSTPVLALLASAIALATLLGTHLSRSPAPLISLEILRNPIVGAVCAATVLGQAAHLGLVIFMPVYLQQGLGLSAGQSGVALLGLLLGTTAGAWTTGRLLPRVARYRRFAYGGATLAVLSLVGLSLTAGTASLLWSELLMIGAGAGIGMTFPVSIVAAQNAVSHAELGAATGVVTFLRSLGGALGVAILGTIALAHGLPLALEGADAVAAGRAPPGDFAVIFAAAAVGMAGALLAYLMLQEKPLQGRAGE